MTNPLLLKNIEIASEDSAKLKKADVLIENGRIKAVDQNIPAPEGAQTINSEGKIIVPGLFDVHVHLREPGEESKETIESGSRAALNGGVTGILAMPNTVPAIDSGGLVKYVLNIAKEKALVPVYTSGCITKGREGKELAEIADMVENGAVMITDDGSPVNNPYVLRRALEYARNFNLPVASHCETMELTDGGAMNEGKNSYKMGVPGVPAISEEICIDRDIRIAQYVGGHIHIQHVTTARGMEIIRRAKEEGVKVTCEVSPHHLIFSDNDIEEYDTHLKMNPPLRTPEDNERLLQGLIDGVFDVIATDHAPHTSAEKGLDFVHAPNGITGLDTAMLAMFTYFIQPGKMGWDTFVKRYSAEPRRLLRHDTVEIKAGQKAEFLIFDPQAQTHIDRHFIQSKSINTPHLDQVLSGSVEKVFLKGTFALDRLEGSAT